MNCQTCGDESATYECDDCFVHRTELDALKATATTAMVVGLVVLLGLLVAVAL